MRQIKSTTSGHGFLQRLSAFGAAGLIGLFALGTAQAEKADQDKPTNIAADHTESDDLHQIDVFTGNVILTKGTIILRADKLLVHQNPEGYQSGVATWDGKTQVYFKQKREGFADQYMEGWADRIEYDEKSSLVKLYDHAIVKRLEGAKDADEARGDTITYNSDTEKYWVEAGKTQQRTYTVIQPKNTAPVAGAPAPAVTGTPATITTPPSTTSAPGTSGSAASTTPVVPPVDLRPSDTLLTRPQ